LHLRGFYIQCKIVLEYLGDISNKIQLEAGGFFLTVKNKKRLERTRRAS